MPIRVRGGAVDGAGQDVTPSPAPEDGGAGAPFHDRPSPQRRPVTRARLACLYGAMFMAAGAVLLTAVSLLAVQAVGRGSDPVLGQGLEQRGALAPAACPGRGPGLPPYPATSGADGACPAPPWWQSRDSLASSALLALLALGSLSASAGYVMSGYALSPLRRMTRTARSTFPPDAGAAGPQT
ncbi:hypothetical protein ABZY44_14310 [Streptomyces sp. NPDC006544]|uniref:hypothetical protein n=1 Tax=Streptomyces sp. NPDC006544 TaxID=3154583 RepID=UPI0033B8FBEC